MEVSLFFMPKIMSVFSLTKLPTGYILGQQIENSGGGSCARKNHIGMHGM